MDGLSYADADNFPSPEIGTPGAAPTPEAPILRDQQVDVPNAPLPQVIPEHDTDTDTPAASGPIADIETNTHAQAD